MIREIVIPVYASHTSGIYDSEPRYPMFETKTRKTWVIRRQINNMMKLMYEFRRDGKTPTHWLINETDYSFIQAFFRYEQSPYGMMFGNSPVAQQAATLFGLQIVLYDGTTTLGWKTR